MTALNVFVILLYSHQLSIISLFIENTLENDTVIHVIMTLSPYSDSFGEFFCYGAYVNPVNSILKSFRI